MSFKLWFFLPPRPLLQSSNSIPSSRSSPNCSLYLSNPQSIFHCLGQSHANWRNCYWFSFFVYLWSFPEPFLEYSHPIMDKVRFVDQPKLEESDIWKNRRHCSDDCAINYVSSEFSKCTSGSLIFSPIAKLPIKLAMIGGASMGAKQMQYKDTIHFRCTWIDVSYRSNTNAIHRENIFSMYMDTIHRWEQYECNT